MTLIEAQVAFGAIENSNRGSSGVVIPTSRARKMTEISPNQLTRSLYIPYITYLPIINKIYHCMASFIKQESCKFILVACLWLYQTCSKIFAEPKFFLLELLIEICSSSKRKILTLEAFDKVRQMMRLLRRYFGPDFFIRLWVRIIDGCLRCLWVTQLPNL